MKSKMKKINVGFFHIRLSIKFFGFYQFIKRVLHIKMYIRILKRLIRTIKKHVLKSIFYDYILFI